MFENFLLSPETIQTSKDVLIGFIGLSFFLLFIVMFLLIAIGIYIYSSFAFMKIAEKTRKEKYLAWIPLVGKPLLSSKIAKMHWWPILLIAGFFVPAIGGLLVLVFSVFYIIWRWHVFKSVGRPGWWILFTIIPLAGGIVYLVLLGIAAWGKPEKQMKKKRRR